MNLKKNIVAVLLALFPVSAMSSVMVYNSSNANLGNFSRIKCGTGITCASSGGKLLMTPALSAGLSGANGETFANSTDDSWVMTSNDEHMSLQIQGFEAKDAILNLYADQGDDTADKFGLKYSAAGLLTFEVNAVAFATFTGSSGALALTGSVTGANADTLANSTDDVWEVASNDEHTIFNVKGFEAKDASIQLYADEGDDTADKFGLKYSAAGALTMELNGSAFTTITPSSGLYAYTGSLSGDGGDSIIGFRQYQLPSATQATSISQCGATWVSNSTDTITLPEASTASSATSGCRYTFVCGTADDFFIDVADGVDSFSVINSVAGGTGAAITPSAGDKIKCTDIGSSITVQAVGDDLWAVIGVGNGAWTDEN